MRPTPTTPMVVRPLQTPAEAARLSQLGVEAFFGVPPEAVERVAAAWTAQLERGPGFAPEQRRGAFRDGVYLGGYLIQERKLRMGAATIPTGCVGMVVTAPEHRRQGVASALLEDAARFARERHLGLLLLDGIPNFYARFGYTDVFDVTVHVIERATIDAQPPSPITVRPATLDDAPALLALYDRHYAHFTASFVRTLEEQRRLLEIRGADNAPLVAIQPDGALGGYLYAGWGGDHAFALEAAADNRPCALALLRHQALRLGASAEPLAARWRIPRDCPTYYALADTLVVADTSAWGVPSAGWSLRGETYAHPDAGWMARPGELAELMRAALPEWQRRLADRQSLWQGDFALTIGGEFEETFVFHLSESGLRRAEHATGDLQAARLSAQAFTQLVFGYRPASWIACQPDQHIPEPLLPLLGALFPTGHTWIPGTDDF